MSRQGQAPKTEQTPNDPISASIETHPAYGQISAARVSGNAILYGSDFEHQHFIHITVTKSELHRGLNNDWHFSREEVVRLSLSEAQWATFVSTMNAGGTCCTLEHISGDALPSISEKKDRKDQIVMEANEKLAEIVADAKALAEEIEGRGRKTVMRDLINGIVAQFSKNSGLAFIARQFGEQVEKTVESAKIEVNAYIESRISRAGLSVLRGEKPPISIPDKSSEKKP